MPLTAELKSKIKEPEILEAIDEIEKDLATRNYEASDRRTKLKKMEDEYKAFQSNHNALIEKIKKIGFDPDADIEEQFPSIVEKVTKDKGFKPSGEFEKLLKTVERLTTEVAAAREEAAKEKREAMIEKAGTQFDPALNEAFGKAAPVVKELLKMKGQLAIKDGVTGIQMGEEFVPLNAEKGTTSAIDIIKKSYSDLVVIKQKGGAGGSANNTGSGNANENGLVTREEFEKFDGAKKAKYMAEKKTFLDLIPE